MPVLDAKALKTDPKGLAFLRDVLRPADTGSQKNVTAASRGLSSRRRKLPEAADASLAR